QRAVKAAPKNTQARSDLVDSCINLGKLHQGTFQYREAIQWYERAAQELVTDEESSRQPRYAGLRSLIKSELAVCNEALTKRTPVAMVLSVKGDATLKKGTAQPQRATAADLVSQGDRLTTPPAGEITLIFVADSHRERLKPGVTATVHI